MGKVIAEITMSLDGFIAGPGISSKNPMGINGQRLHEWIFNRATDTDKAMIAEIMKSIGAVITGNHTYATAIDEAWSGATPFDVPVFVICHGAPEKKINGFVYATGEIQETLELARKAAGEKNTWIMGGANIIQQYIKAGLIEELHLHIASILLMRGTKLFDNTIADPVELTRKNVTATPGALHTVFCFNK
ncbi:MAG: dihydrofolate reductase family protein [Chitinophagaceae bacterium]